MYSGRIQKANIMTGNSNSNIPLKFTAAAGHFSDIMTLLHGIKFCYNIKRIRNVLSDILAVN